MDDSADAEDLVLLRMHPRPSELVTLSIPTDVLAGIDEIAALRDMSPEALLKLYIGQGLRVDAERLLPGPPPWRHRPNAVTRQALDDAAARRGLTSHRSMDALFDELLGE